MIVPTGFRFNPTDEELIEILERKVSGKAMPLHDCFIVERNLYEHEPEDLEWDQTMAVHKNERYFYCIRENDSREVSGRGWWKATSHVKKINANKECVVGYKRPLTFHKFKDDKRKRNKAVKTNWIMYEYSLESYTTEWRICKIKYKGNQTVQVQEEVENVKKYYSLSNESGGSCSIMEMQSAFVDEELQPPQSIDQTEKIYEPGFGQNMNTDVMDEQQLFLYASCSYDPILTHITNDYYYCDQLEHPFSADVLLPSFWSC
ncbi:NAC domain-containing protein 41-like [Pistacia vera]|uniref:NAC domain-containing protein 41-like n=1 Tax=Pistacia vera TaxID=55513 RepID=UPI001263D95B|nr:NAC domain-containing protein 41-like [Pistacia vera]